MELAVTRSAVCVLVGAHSDNQRRGLGKAVVTEGLRWLKRVGATRALANGYDSQANALYASVLAACRRTLVSKRNSPQVGEKSQ